MTTSTVTTPTRPQPVPTAATKPFWDATAKNTLLIQRCGDCNKKHSTPRLFCITCLSENLQWDTASGLGTIYTFTVNHRAANAHMTDKVPYVVAVVELDEGVRMMGNIVNCGPASVRIGERVKVCWLPLSESIHLPQFEPL